MHSHGESVRRQLPTLMDAQVGLAIASPQPASAAVVPSTAPMSRPDLSSQLESSVGELTWPPEPGQYDDRGLVKQAGELTSLFLALTFEEVRAFIAGLTQPRPPTRDAKLQVFNAAHALIAQISTQRLNLTQYRTAWARLFDGDTPNHSASSDPQLDPQLDPSRPPQPVGALAANVVAVTPLASTSLTGFPFANRNTDAAMRLRITTGAANVPPNQAITTIQFGSEYRTPPSDAASVGLPTQSVVVLNSALQRFYADNITASSFTLMNASALQAGTSFDVFVLVSA